MRILPILLAIIFFFPQSKSLTSTNILLKNDTIQQTDTIVIDINKIEGDTNYTVINQEKGKYKIGDTVIERSNFKSFQGDKISSKLLSFNKKLLYLAKIEIRREAYNPEENLGDTTIIFGTRKMIKPFVKKRKMGFYDQPHVGFLNNCPPSRCFHYYIGINNAKILVKAFNSTDLKKLIPKVITPADAFFFVEDNPYIGGIYALSKKGYLVVINTKVRDCPMTFADKLYFIDFKGNVKEMGENTTQITRLCIHP
jgi:hypothetical protein